MNIIIDQKILWKFVGLGKLAPIIRERSKYEIGDTSHSNNQRTKTQDDQQFQIHASSTGSRRSSLRLRRISLGSLFERMLLQSATTNQTTESCRFL